MEEHSAGSLSLLHFPVKKKYLFLFLLFARFDSFPCANWSRTNDSKVEGSNFFLTQYIRMHSEHNTRRKRKSLDQNHKKKEMEKKEKETLDTNRRSRPETSSNEPSQGFGSLSNGEWPPKACVYFDDLSGARYRLADFLIASVPCSPAFCFFLFLSFFV